MSQNKTRSIFCGKNDVVLPPIVDEMMSYDPNKNGAMRLGAKHRASTHTSTHTSFHAKQENKMIDTEAERAQYMAEQIEYEIEHDLEVLRKGQEKLFAQVAPHVDHATQRMMAKLVVERMKKFRQKDASKMRGEFQTKRLTDKRKQTVYFYLLPIKNSPDALSALPYSAIREHWLPNKAGGKSVGAAPHPCFKDRGHKSCPACDKGLRPSTRYLANIYIPSFVVGPNGKRHSVNESLAPHEGRGRTMWFKLPVAIKDVIDEAILQGHVPHNPASAMLFKMTKQHIGGATMNVSYGESEFAALAPHPIADSEDELGAIMLQAKDLSESITPVTCAQVYDMVKALKNI